jgi:hypothetical protein
VKEEKAELWIRIHRTRIRIRIEGFDDQKQKKNTADNFLYLFFLIKNCNLLMSKLQEKSSALKREHGAFQKIKFINFFLCLWIIFALLDPDTDTDPGTPMNPDPVRIRIHNF